MKRTLLVAAAVLAIVALTGCGRSATPAAGGGSAGATANVKLMVGGMNKQIYLSAKLTGQLGYFAAVGLNVQLSDEPAGVNAETAMLAGPVAAAVGLADHTHRLPGRATPPETIVPAPQTPCPVG